MGAPKVHPVKDDMENPNYNPVHFFDWLMFDVYKVRTLSALARKVKLDLAQISRMRHKHGPVSLTLLVQVHYHTNMHIRQIREKLYRGPAPTA